MNVLSMEGRDNLVWCEHKAHLLSNVYWTDIVPVPDRNLLSGFVPGTSELMKIKRLFCNHMTLYQAYSNAYEFQLFSN